MRQGIVLPETPRQRRERAALEEDLQTISLIGKPLPDPRAALPARRRRVSRRHARAAPVHAAAARDRAADGASTRPSSADAWHGAGRGECDGDAERFRATLARRGRAGPRSTRSTTSSTGTTAGIPPSRSLPMDPRTGDFALVNGRDYRLGPLDAAWVLERLPGGAQRARPPCPDERVDRVALLAADVAKDGRAFSISRPGSSAAISLGRVEEVGIARPADAVRQIREVVSDEEKRSAGRDGGRRLSRGRHLRRAAGGGGRGRGRGRRTPEPGSYSTRSAQTNSHA